MHLGRTEQYLSPIISHRNDATKCYEPDPNAMAGILVPLLRVLEITLITGGEGQDQDVNEKMDFSGVYKGSGHKKRWLEF